MPQSKQWAYVLHQAYGDIPPVTFYDDNTLDAFTSHSTWAFAERDDPMTSIRSEAQSTGNDDSENEKEDDNEEDEEEDGNDDPLQKKHIDQGLRVLLLELSCEFLKYSVGLQLNCDDG